MELDFGGIGKEYAADRAAAAMEQHGARRGFVDLGGDVRAIGPPEGDSAWHIAIRHPRGAPGESIGAVDVARGAVATSGDYERGFDADGVRYCHLLDPRTGWPARFWQSVSVQAPVCVAAGACATIAMLMPVDEAVAFLQRQGLRYLAVAADGSLRRG
jgi:thiamine biosynthesis lipoprotein